MSTETQLSMIPVAPTQIVQWAPHIESGLREAIDESYNETTLENVGAILASGAAQLWVVLVDGKYAGFWVTEMQNTATNTWLYISFGYSVPEYRGFKLLVQSFNHFEDYAQSLPGCTGVRLMSGHENYKALTRDRFGYKVRYVEYVKEFDAPSTDSEEE